jgi:23S rRNA pseudouridine2605 synthase
MAEPRKRAGASAGRNAGGKKARSAGTARAARSTAAGKKPGAKHAKKPDSKNPTGRRSPGKKAPGKRSAGERAARGTMTALPVEGQSTQILRAAKASPPKEAVHDPDGVRLQRVLASAGMGSRRACEQLIDEGRVEVDGAVVHEQGLRVDPSHAVIKVDGMRIQSAPDLVYLMLNKPTGVVSTMSDPEGRPSLADFVAERNARLFHVGRLDADTEGLLLLTNDGELAHRLAHPSFGVVKTYLAEITGPVARDVGKRLKAGVTLEDGLVQADSFRLIGSVGSRVMVEVSLHEGRKHVVRRMLTEVGHPVTRLVRTDFGPISLGNLKPGKQRKLSQQEVGLLYQAVEL